MSADKFMPIVCDTPEGRLYIGGVSSDDAEECAKNGAGIVLLSARPEHYGALEAVLEINPQIPVYATAASLRSIKQILNREINERLLKNGMKKGKYEFKTVPDISWIDSVAVYEDGEIILCEESESGECHSESRKTPVAYIVYSSKYGFTKSLADAAGTELSDMYDIVLRNAEEMNDEEIQEVNNADILLVGTHTINRNAPQSIWRIITSLDQVRKRGMSYLVFGSYGWAGDGIKLIHKTLKEMGMRPINNPVEVLFKPTEEDYRLLKKAAAKFKENKK